MLAIRVSCIRECKPSVDRIERPKNETKTEHAESQMDDKHASDDAAGALVLAAFPSEDIKLQPLHDLPKENWVAAQTHPEHAIAEYFTTIEQTVSPPALYHIIWILLGHAAAGTAPGASESSTTTTRNHSCSYRSARIGNFKLLTFSHATMGHSDDKILTVHLGREGVSCLECGRRNNSHPSWVLVGAPPRRMPQSRLQVQSFSGSCLLYYVFRRLGVQGDR
jgi:hypothetical protein